MPISCMLIMLAKTSKTLHKTYTEKRIFIAHPGILTKPTRDAITVMDAMKISHGVTIRHISLNAIDTPLR